MLGIMFFDMRGVLGQPVGIPSGASPMVYNLWLNIQEGRGGARWEPGGARRSQWEPGGARGSQGQPEGDSRSQEEPGGARRSPEELGGARRKQERACEQVVKTHQKMFLSCVSVAELL